MLIMHFIIEVFALHRAFQGSRHAFRVIVSSSQRASLSLVRCTNSFNRHPRLQVHWIAFTEDYRKAGNRLLRNTDAYISVVPFSYL